jgi:hypothetical protein
MYNPDNNCPAEANLLRQMAKENYAGHARAVIDLSYSLTEHRKTCPVCQGMPLVDVFFGQTVVVADVYHDA